MVLADTYAGTSGEILVSDAVFPQNLEAERAVLGACILVNKLVPEAAQLVVAEDFYSRGHQLTWASILNLWEKGGAVDVVLLRNALRQKEELEAVGGVGYLSGLTDIVPTAGNVRHYARIVRSCSWQRKALRFALELQEACAKGNGNLQGVLAAGYEELIRALPVEQRTLETVGADLEARMASADYTLQDGAVFGISEVDDAVGGFSPGRYYVLGGRPGTGKTSLALQAVWRTVARGGRVLMMSFEMSDIDLIERIVSQEGRIDLRHLRQTTTRKEEKEQFAQNLRRIVSAAAGRLLLLTPQTTDVDTLLTEIAAVHSRTPLDLVVIDYLQRLDAFGVERSETARISTVSRRLADKARCLNVAILALAQLHRLEGGDAAEPTMSDLRQSGQIEQDADVILLLWGKVEEERRGYKLAKGRYGPTVRGELRFDGWCTRFGAIERREAGAPELKQPDPQRDELPFKLGERKWARTQA